MAACQNAAGKVERDPRSARERESGGAPGAAVRSGGLCWGGDAPPSGKKGQLTLRRSRNATAASGGRAARDQRQTNYNARCVAAVAS